MPIFTNSVFPAAGEAGDGGVGPSGVPTPVAANVKQGQRVF